MNNIPVALNTEKALLGSIVLSCNILSEVKKRISEADFFNIKNRQLYKYLCEQKSPFDLTILKDKLDASNISYLLECIDLSGGPEIWPVYVAKLKDYSQQRRIVNLANKIVNETKESDDTLNVVQWKKELENIISDYRDEVFSLTDELVAIAEELEKRKTFKEIKFPTGLQDLDKIVNIRSGRIYVIAARPGSGKTSWITSVINYLIDNRTNLKILLFSLEMGKREILYKLLSLRTKISTTQFDFPETLTKAQWDMIVSELGKISNKNLIISDKKLDINQIELKISQVKPDIVFIDFLQHMNFSNEQAANMPLLLSETIKRLKFISKEYSVPIIIASQRSRKAEDDISKIPKLSSLKWSGGIEENADVIWFIDWDNPNDVNDLNVKEAIVNLYMIKNRFGPTGKIRLLFKKTITLFHDYVDIKKE